MTKKTVFLVSFMNVAGAQEAAARVAFGLRGKDFDTELWFFYREAYVAHFQDQPGVHILLDTDKPGAIGYLKIFWLLFWRLRKTRPDATVSFLPLANVAGQFVAWLAGVKHRVASARSPISTYSKAMRIGDKVMARFGIYNRIIGVTREVANGYNYASAKVRSKIGVVYNGINWRPARLKKKAARKKFGLPQDAILFVSVGRFKTQKNYPFQVKIAGILGKKVAIVVAGDGPEKPATEAAVASNGDSEHMIFLGNVAKADMPALLAAVDGFIQPSLYEGQSNALLEAMYQGLPVLVSDVADQRETIIDGNGTHSGLLIELDDPKKWADAMNGLAKDEEARADWAKKAKTRSKDFSVERQIEGFANIIAPQRIQPEGRSLSKFTPELLRLRWPDAYADTIISAPESNFLSNVSLEDAADVIYSLYLSGNRNLLTAQVADRLAHRMQNTKLAGNLSDNAGSTLETANVHRTAYGLAAMALLAELGHDRFGKVLAPAAFQLNQIIDSETGLPIFPAKFTHHNWRVSHWIGGVPAILQIMHRRGNKKVRAALSGDFSVETILAKAGSVVVPETGKLKCYKSNLLQVIFRNLYRVRHDPDLGDLGGIAHLIWVQHGEKAPVIGAKSVAKDSESLLLKHRPFMEHVPYCLDFDIVANLRMASLSAEISISGAAVERAEKLYADILGFLSNEQGVQRNYTLHKIPGALATMHECALLADMDQTEVKKQLGSAPTDIILEAGWL